jgi:cyclopropane fatty-acyl-phospholipid synthase-like methyltransferase
MNERELRALTFDFRAARAVMAAVSLGVIECLASAPADAERIARDCGLAVRGARALLEALAALGLLEETAGSFALTPAARRVLLCTGDHSRRSTVLHDLWHWGLWAGLEGSLRSGAPVSDRKHDPFFSDGAVLAAFFPNFARAMDETGRAASARLARELRLTGCERVLDLGGGAGCFSAALARTYPTVEIELLDLPPVAREAERALGLFGPEGRVKVRAADFRADPLDPTGAGYDVVLLSRVLMGLDDRAAVALLQRAAATLRPEGRIAVHEFRRAQGAADRVGALLDLDMLLLTGGAVRRPDELAALLERGGLTRVAYRRFGPIGMLVEGRR